MTWKLYLLANTAWDLLLGVIPAVLGHVLARILRRSPRPRWWVGIPLALLWLAFLPNACYLLTEMRHYLELNPYWAFSGQGHVGVRRFLLWSAFYAGFSGSGLVLFTLAIRPVERLLKPYPAGRILLLAVVFLGSALGVYLGLRLRFNSWDLVTAPGAVLDAAREALFGQGVAGVYIVGLAGALWVAYLVVDIWFDGLKLRLGKRKGAKP